MNFRRAEDLLGVLANKTRLRLMKLLVSFEEEICVCEFEDALDLPQYTVSRHLNKLKEGNLVESRREGTWAYYSIHSGLSPGKEEIVNWIENYTGEDTFEKDLEEMEDRLTMRDNEKCVARRDEETS